MNKPLRIDYPEKVVISAANGEKMLARQKQIASDLAYYMERGFAESKKEMTSKCNKALYDLAEKRGISLWDLCFSVVPPILLWECSTDTTLTMQGMSYLASTAKENIVVGAMKYSPWN